MKKLFLGLLSACSILTMCIVSTPVGATDFSKDEDKYYKLCSSSLSANQKTCDEFNDYLKDKNKDLKKEINEGKKDINETASSIAEVESKISSLATELSAKEKEIDYLLNSITTIEKNIDTKETEMRDRLYTMQTSYNSNSYISFLFGASDFSDFFARLSAINDITSYEKELVDQLTKQKKDLDAQKATLVDAKASLQVQQNSQKALQDKLVDLKSAQQAEVNNNVSEQKKVSEAQAKLDAQLEALIDNDPGSGSSGGSIVAGSSEVGNAIAQKALTKLGSRYWWGANGPTYFDCSGLVYWACNQAGVKIGRTTAAGYSRSGKAVSRSELQAGDVITFSYGSGVAHIGIYIGGGNFVHASGKGSGTVGQYPEQCVKVSALAGYWSNYVYNYRRLY